MKVLHVCGDFSPCFKSGGVVRVVYDLSKELVKRGHKVTVYTTDRCDKRLKMNPTANIEGIEAHYFKNLSNKFSWKTNIYMPIGLIKRVKKDLKKFDIIHIHEHRTLLAAIVSHYAKKYNKPYILQAHGSVKQAFQKQKLKKLFDFLFGYKVLYGASKVIALTKTEERDYISMGVDKDKIKIIPNGLYLDDYKNLPKKGKFRKDYHFEKDCFMCLYVGRIHENKGLDLLVKWFKNKKEIDYNGIESKLVVIGPDAGYLKTFGKLVMENGLSENVIYTGFVPKDIKFSAMKDADVLLIPKSSGFPVTLLEGMICKTRNIGLMYSDEMEWMKYFGKNIGYWIDGETGYKLVRKRFNWTKLARVFEKEYYGQKN